MGQGCSTHVVLCLDSDLQRDAMLTAYKDAVINQKGADRCAWYPRFDWTNGAAGQLDFMRQTIEAGLPIGLDGESKLTIVCHASPTSFGLKEITPHNLARLVQATLGKQRIKRVSILGCQAGGKRTFKGWAVEPGQSATFKFASYAGRMTASVTARTGRTVLAANSLHGGRAYSDIQQKVKYDGINSRHHGKEDKAVFTPNPNSTTTDPKAPAWAFKTYDVWN